MGKMVKFSKGQLEVIGEKLRCKIMDCNFLATGSHNECYKLITNKGTYALKIGNDEKKLGEEFRILKMLDVGIAPQVFVYDNSRNIVSKPFLIEEFLVGKHPRKKASDEFIFQMAKWYKELHKIKSNKIAGDERKRFNSLSFWCKGRYDKFSEYRGSIDDKLAAEIEWIFRRMLEQCKKRDSVFSGRIQFSLTQNDPSNDNVFIDEKKIKVIDWEFSGFGLYERDLLTFIQQYRLNERQEKLFLRAYGYSNDREAQERLKILKVILLGGDTAYLVERLSMIKEGKIGKKQQSSKEKPLKEKIDKILRKTDVLLKELENEKFQKKWTRPQLRNAIKPYPPLKK